MSRRVHLAISVTLLLFVFVTPYIALVKGQDYTITIAPIPPEFITKPPLFTQNPELFDGYSAFADRTPRIDGAITSGFNYQGVKIGGEWDDAVKIDFQLNITQSELGKSEEAHNATLYIKNDFINIYLALVVFDEESDKGDLVHFNFDNQYNQEIDSGDDQLLVDGYTSKFRDLCFKADGSSEIDSEQNGVGAAQWYSPFFVVEPIYTFMPLTLTATTITSPGKAAQDVRQLSFPGTWIFEVAHPLNSADDKHDLNAQPGDIIGISTTYWDIFRDNNAGGFPTLNNWKNMLKYKIAGPPVTGATIDFKIDSIELVQAVQNTSSGLPLARRKTTVARVFLDPGTFTGSTPANVYLYGMDGKTGSSLPGPLVASINAPTSAIRTRTVITHSANFLLPTSWIDLDHLDLTAFVTSSSIEKNFDNNWLVPKKQFSFHNTKVLTIYEIPINTGTAKNPVTVSNALITQYEKAMQRVFPVEKINFKRLDWKVMGGPWTGTFQQALTKLNEVMGQYVYAWLLGYAIKGEMPFLLPDLIFGYYTKNVGGLGGLSDPTWDGGKGYVAVGYIAVNEELTMAHELTHNLDRAANGAGTWGRHTGPNVAGNCQAPGPDPNWPHMDDDLNEVGVDVSVWPPVIIPWDYPDYMGYCDSSSSTLATTALQAQYTQWISDYRWEQLFEELEQSLLYPNFASKAFADSSPQFDIHAISYEEHIPQTLQITGWISRDSSGSIDSILQLDSLNQAALQEFVAEYPHLESFVGDVIRDQNVRPDSLPPDTILYELVVIDPVGSELRTFYFTGKFLNHEDFEEEQEYFSQHIPRIEGLEPGARIELRLGERVLDVQEVSPSVPEVHLISPNGGEEWGYDEEAIVEWEAYDPEEDELLYTVHYSPDGTYWLPLATGLKEPFLVVDPSKIPGSGEEGAYIRVMASDGFNIGQDINIDPFFVRDNPPEVYIDLPIAGQVYGYADLIPLQGHGFDTEDGALPDSSLRWEFAGNLLGYGQSINIVRLGPGEHTIHLIGTDSAGNEGLAQIQIIIGLDEVAPPVMDDDIIRVGPGLLSLQIETDPPFPLPREPTNLFVLVTNHGSDPAFEVTVQMRLPFGLRLLSDSDRANWEVIEPGQTVEHEFIVLGEDPEIYEIGFELESANRSPTVEFIVLNYSAEEPEPDITSIETRPPSESGLNLRTFVEPTRVPPGDPVVFVVHITNNNEEPINGVELNLILPPGIYLVTGTGPFVWEIIESGQTVEREYLISGESPGSYEIRVEIASPNIPLIYDQITLIVGSETDETSIPVTLISSTIPFTSETSESSGIPGFEAYSVLITIPFIRWIRKRRKRK